MARRTLIITGDKALTRKLNALAGPKAKAINRKAARKAIKLVLDRAKGKVPVRSGRFKRSLTVRAGKRSRKSIRMIVTQKEVNRGGTDKDKAFYGSFLELGYTATGRPRKEGSGLDTDNDLDANDIWTPREKATRDKSITTYRRKTFKIRQLRKAKKVPARWIMRQAGKDAEDEALELYRSEIGKLIEEA